jgi:sulfite exporter TauE/SafE
MFTALMSGLMLGLVNLMHCAGMCGPLSGAVCLRSGRVGLARYQIGRVSSYVFLGALSGHLGRALAVAVPATVSVWLTASLTAAACLLTARSLLRASASATLLPASALCAPRSQQPSLFALLTSLAPRDPFVFGLLSALLPCGVLASAVLAAVASGSAASGSLLMAAFAFMSGSAVLAAGFVMQLVPGRFAPLFRRGLACALVAIALLSVARPLSALSRTASSPSHALHCH